MVGLVLLVLMVVLPVGGGAILNAVWPPDLSRLAPTVSVTDRDGRLLRAFLSPDGTWRLPTTPADVDPLYLTMLMTYEDARFRWHPGVDPLAVVRATGQAVASGRVVSGASTLTMQAARLLEPRPRTVSSKLIEMVRAVQLTARLGRDGVLSAYLTLAPFGGNIEGVRAASRAWWGKAPRHLTPGQAALLVALPQNPNGLRPDRHPEAARAARAKVLRRMVAAGVLSARVAREAAEEPLPTVRRPMPRLAAHEARRLVDARPADAPPSIRTTLDHDLQDRIEALVSAHAAALGARMSVAVLVVEAATGAVRARVGSPDLLDTDRLGAIDMTRAVRSPGSALKPLIYGMAFEAGVLHPLTAIDDRPTAFGDGYAPGNFGFAHFGRVTAAEALRHSLNVPAVAVLDRVGPMRFAARLRAAGVVPRRRGGLGRPGLPLALGGLGVTLEDLVGIYVALAAGGERRALTILAHDESRTRAAGSQPPVRVLSEVAAWQVRSILAEAPPAAGFAPDDATRGGRTVAFKTGTSYGFRDAWAVGMDGGHVVGVWVGRADGTPVPGRIGRDTAAPLMRTLFDLLPLSSVGMPGPRPPDLPVVTRTSDLPPPLRRLEPPGERGPSARLAAERPVRLAFPPDGAVLDWDQAVQGVVLEAAGGRRPYAWLVDGRPLETAPWHRGAQWQPPGQGAARITVVDADGRADSATVWLGPPPGVSTPDLDVID